MEETFFKLTKEELSCMREGLKFVRRTVEDESFIDKAGLAIDPGVAGNMFIVSVARDKYAECVAATREEAVAPKR